MTEMKDLPAGRELDALVAERVFGCAVEHHDVAFPSERFFKRMPGVPAPWPDADWGTVYWPRAGTHDWKTIPNFSTDIAAAWTVVEKLFADGVADTVHVWKDGAIFLNDREPVSQHGEGPAPLAICRAALKAVESAR